MSPESAIAALLLSIEIIIRQGNRGELAVRVLWSLFLLVWCIALDTNAGQDNRRIDWQGVALAFSIWNATIIV